METVVITGSARGLGFEMAKKFRAYDFNVVISDLNEENLLSAKKEIEEIKSKGKVLYKVCDVSKYEDLENLIEYAEAELNSVDIWINNAGVNQPMKAMWELDKEEIDKIIEVDLKGTIHGSLIAMKKMSKVGKGAIYNVEGYGSNNAHMLGLNMYGTNKRAITHFTEGLAKESEEKKTGVLVGRLSPGIMITDFTTHAFVDKVIDLPEKTKNIYNILGDTPDVVAKFLVEKMVKNNKKNNVKFEWLTNKKAFLRFMTAGFNKRDFFKINH